MALLLKNQELEERLFKQESLVDRLTRDKVSLTSDLESYKQKCNSIDFDNHNVTLNVILKVDFYFYFLSSEQ